MLNLLAGRVSRVKLLSSRDSAKGTEVVRLRAHHICCIPFFRPIFSVIFKERGSDFCWLINKIKSILLSQPETLVMVIEGVDELCSLCPLCIDGRCASPLGNEDEVRKWDAILLKELDLSFGSCLTCSQWQALIEQKTPFKLCGKCKWKEVCSIGANLL